MDRSTFGLVWAGSADIVDVESTDVAKVRAANGYWCGEGATLLLVVRVVGVGEMMGLEGEGDVV